MTVDVIRCLTFLPESARVVLALLPQDLPTALLTGNKFPASFHIRRMLLSVAERRPPDRARIPRIGRRIRGGNALSSNQGHAAAITTSSPLTDGRTGPGMMITCTSVKRLELHQKLPFRALTTRGTVWFAEHRSRNTAEHFSLLLITIFQVFKLSFSLHSCSNLVSS
jgi:hypothetical protein